MPLFIIVGVAAAICVCVAIYIVKKKRVSGTNRNIFDIVIFGLSLFALILSFTSLMRVSRYVSDYGGSAIRIYGEMGAFLPLLELAVLFILCAISGISLIARSK